LKQKWQNIPPGSVFGKSLEFIKNYSFKIKDHSNIDVNVCLQIVLSRHALNAPLNDGHSTAQSHREREKEKVAGANERGARVRKKINKSFGILKEAGKKKRKHDGVCDDDNGRLYYIYSIK